MTETENAICTALNTYCFLKIWNEPVSEYRVNFRPFIMDTHTRSGAISVNGILKNLPREDEPFYLYSIPTDLFRNAFWLPRLTWVNGEVLCNQYNVLLHVYTEKGRMCAARECYLMLLPAENAYILAITKRNLRALCKHEDASKIYITIYKDSDLANDTVIHSYMIPLNDRNGTYRNSIFRVLEQINNPEQIIMYVNGYEAEIESTDDLGYGDFVDIIEDKNIVASFELDCTDNTKYRIYYSDMDELDKVIVHMPKELNPQQKVFTHNTCDFFVRKKEPTQYKEEGLYVQRTAERSISQITHQDFSVPLYILDAYRDNLGIPRIQYGTELRDSVQAVKIKVIVRQHDKDNVLVRDKNYIDMLYTQDDDTIVECLSGRVDNAPKFWLAQNLEKSVYVSMMFDVPEIITEENMWYYVEGLGYYHTIGLLCNRVSSYSVTDLFNNYLSFKKPYLFKNKTIYPLIYHNGYKIPDNDLIFSQNLEEGIDVSFLNRNFNVGDDLSIEMFIDGNRQSNTFTPTSDNLTITLPYRDYVCYQKINDYPIEHLGVDFKSNISYKKITSWTGVATVKYDETTNYTTFVFSPAVLNNTYLFQNKYCVRPMRLTSLLKDKINHGDPLVFNLDARTTDNETVPILEPQSVQVFLNSKYLINGLDYNITRIEHTESKNLCMYQLVIQNKSYLLGEDQDELEVYVTSAETEDTSFGFVKNNKIIHSNNKILALWFDNISTSFIEGKLELGLVNNSTHMLVPDNGYRQGAPYEISTRLPTLVKDFVDLYHGNDDMARMIELNEYFYGLKHTLEGMIILPYSHEIYSIYLNTIIRDIIYGTFDIAYDPDLPRLLQQVTPYDYLKKFDNTFTNRTDIDVTYVDIFPTYSEWGGIPVEKVQLIHALTKLLMPVDNFSDGEITHVH